MATARLGHTHLLLRDHDVAWRAIDLIGQSPLVDAHGRVPDARDGINFVHQLDEPNHC